MVDAPHQRYAPGRVGVTEAAARTGHTTDAAGTPAGAVLLDVRESHERQTGQAPRAVHRPLSALVAGAPLDAAQGAPLIVICRSGNRSRQAAALFAGRGAGAVDATGGMRNRADAGPVVVDAHGGNGSVS
ncbi:rhodanese-like domain-containing protein [Streptomyces werraensis]|uniref:rhodanese-like domain-containing protein n=1 Tax=Streptomyces werraensis TaxID=68284 RepID=UPI003442014D